MNPLDYIKEGILKGNWETVCEGYERLTGEALRLPTDSSNEKKRAKEVLLQIRDIASDFIEGPMSEICSTSDGSKKRKKKSGRRKGSGKKKTTSKITVTKDGEDFSLQLDESKKNIVQKQAGEVQLITNEPIQEEVEINQARAKRSEKNKLNIKRKVAIKHRVKCNECEKKFESDRKGGEMGQKCPRCLSGLKSRFV